jgi:DNA polymerase-3 subunit epsilon
MLIIDKGRTIDEKSVVLIKNSKYIGFGYFSLNYQINNYNILESLITQTKSTFNFQNLIVKFLKKNNVEKILNTDSYK